MARLKVKDILNMDINTFQNYDIKQMRQVVQTLASAGNKRLKDFDLKGLESPATRYIKDSGGKFSTKGKNLNQLRNEFARARAFFESETGSVRGYRKVQKETIDELKKQGVNIKADQWDIFWRAYEKLKQLDRGIANRRFKYVGMREIAQRMKDLEKGSSVDDLVLSIQARLQAMYESQESQHASGVSQFFDI